MFESMHSKTAPIDQQSFSRLPNAYDLIIFAGIVLFDQKVSFCRWVLQSNKSRNFDFSMLLSLTIDRSACIGKPLIAEAVHCICEDKGFEGSLSIARKNCILFLQYFFLYLSNRKVITSLTRKSLASKGLLKIYAHI